MPLMKKPLKKTFFDDDEEFNPLMKEVTMPWRSRNSQTERVSTADPNPPKKEDDEHLVLINSSQIKELKRKFDEAGAAHSHN